MERQILNFRFNDPNTPLETAQLVYRVFLKAGKRRLDRAILQVQASTDLSGDCTSKT